MRCGNGNWTIVQASPLPKGSGLFSFDPTPISCVLSDAVGTLVSVDVAIDTALSQPRTAMVSKRFGYACESAVFELPAKAETIAVLFFGELVASTRWNWVRDKERVQVPNPLAVGQRARQFAAGVEMTAPSFPLLSSWAIPWG